ncbi:MAG: Transcriptional regulator, GntR family [Firmicutes bacterium]|nr:Transcriptional regulator, GntR family [Bacillota bacterium]
MEKREKGQPAEKYVYSKIKEAIIKRNIRPCNQLVETTIAERLGVSRTPVRAAIKRLAYEGFVEICPARGAFVIKPTAEEINDTFDVRIHLEGYSAFLAASNMRTDDYAELEKLIEQEHKAFECRDFEAYSSINDQLHMYIAKKSGRKVLYNYICDILNKTNIYLILFDPFYHIQFNPSMDEHRSIVEMLKEGNGEGASKAMKDHLNTTLNGLNLDEIQVESDNSLFL